MYQIKCHYRNYPTYAYFNVNIFGYRCIYIYTVYIQIFEAHNFRTLLFPNILRKQFSQIKSFEYTVFKNFTSLIFMDRWDP